MSFSKKTLLMMALATLAVILQEHRTSSSWTVEVESPADLNLDRNEDVEGVERSFKEMLAKKQFRDLFSPYDINQEERRLVPVYRSASHKHCNCELKKQKIDLGVGYFPRYLQSGSCNPDSCDKYYRCTEKKYSVMVLKAKPSEDSSRFCENHSLARLIHEAFSRDVKEVIVACQCVIDIP